jgi:hypothetical protein
MEAGTAWDSEGGTHERRLLEDEDCREFSLLVEQIFVCLLQTYRANIMRPLTGLFPTKRASTASTTNTVNKTRNPAKHAEAMHIAHYFNTVSEAVFSETGFQGGIERASFGVSLGANYSSPYFEWSQKSEQILWIRQDTYKKYRERGQTVPMTVFRTAKTKRAHFTKVGTADLYRHKKFTITQETLSLDLSYNETLCDGTKCPREDAQYHVVFEVRTDGLAHPHHWSRLPDIGDFHWQYELSGSIHQTRESGGTATSMLGTSTCCILSMWLVLKNPIGQL